jgi:hypothetical protein
MLPHPRLMHHAQLHTCWILTAYPESRNSSISFVGMAVTPKRMREKGFDLVVARAMIDTIGYWLLTFV